MPISPKVGGTHKNANGLFAKVNGGWKKAQFGYVKVAGQWKQFWAGSLEDTFDRADTTSSLGTASGSGQAWTVVRSQWRINSNNANTTGAKTDYPLALIDLGITEIEAEMNGMSPGAGIALRSTNASNWLAIYPYYREESYTYSYCAQSGIENYCIAQCTTPSYYDLACLPPNTLLTFTEYYGDCYAPGCPATETGGEWVCEDCNCEPDTVTEVCQPATEECFTYYLCDDYCSSSCCGTLEPITRCVPNGAVECNLEVIPGACDCCPVYIPGDLTCNENSAACQTPVYIEECSPDGFTNVPVYDCCQFGQREVCIQSATATGYNYYYNIRVAKMENGVFSVVQDIPVNRRWNALKVTASGVNLAINVYADAAYTDLVGSANVTNGIAGTAYGVMAAPSLYEDGRNIGAMKVKAIGQ